MPAPTTLQSSRSTATPGRPRHTGPRSSALSAREEVLDHAARLIVAHGFAATSTRDIAEACGIRQSSLYYHFPAGKDELLAELLGRSVRPTMDRVRAIESASPPACALYGLVLIDVETLAATRQNLGVLHHLPDVIESPAYAQFSDTHRELTSAYGRIGAAVVKLARGRVVDSERLGTLLIHAVESVITRRATGDSIDSQTAEELAEFCLRSCGLDDDRVEQAAERARALDFRSLAGKYQLESQEA